MQILGEIKAENRFGSEQIIRDLIRSDEMCFGD